MEGESLEAATIRNHRHRHSVNHFGQKKPGLLFLEREHRVATKAVFKI